MTVEAQNVGADLAFLRALAEGGGELQRGTGAALVAGGLLYGLQCFVFGAQALGWLVLSETQGGIFATAITLLFLVVLALIHWRQRNAAEGGVAARALVAAFAASGTATVAMLCVFLNVALREQSFTIWMLFPCAVFALQGAAWMVAWLLRRRAWLGAVALGWMLSSVALSFAIGSPVYAFVAGFALLLFMALPGAVMMQPAKV